MPSRFRANFCRKRNGPHRILRRDEAMRMAAIRALVVRPYSQFAATYDRTLGIRVFLRIRRTFETLVKHYGIKFRSAADLGCGTGLFACYLSRSRGIPVFAVDLSREMLRAAVRNCDGLNVRFLQQDIRCLRLPYPVDLLTANFDTLNHLVRDSDLQMAFRRIHENLQPDGHLYFDLVTPCQPLGGGRSYMRRLRTTSPQVIQQIRWDPRRKILSIFVVLHSPGSPPSTVEVLRERAYSLSEVGRWLMEAGFVIRGVHDEATLSAADGCPARIIVVVEKLLKLIHQKVTINPARRGSACTYGKWKG